MLNGVGYIFIKRRGRGAFYLNLSLWCSMITDAGSLLLSVVCLFRYICRMASVHSRFASMHSTLEERLRRRLVVMPARFNSASAPSTILRRSSASSLHRLKRQIEQRLHIFINASPTRQMPRGGLGGECIKVNYRGGY